MRASRSEVPGKSGNGGTGYTVPLFLMSAPGAVTACSDHYIELASEPGDSRDAGHCSTVQDKDHTCFVGDAVPLAAYGVKGCALEPEAGVVFGVSEYDHEGTSPLLEERNPRSDKLRTDTLSLVFRQDSHGRKPHSRNRTFSAFDHNRAEKDVTHDAATGKGNERQQAGAVRPQRNDDVRLVRPAKGLLIDPPYRLPVLFTLFPDLDHDGTFPSPITVCPFLLL